MVKMVEEELKIEVKDDIRAASITANIIPLAPVGISSVTSFTNAMLVHPLLLPQILKHSWKNNRRLINQSQKHSPSGCAHATSSVKSTLAAIPGKIMMNRGSNLRYPVKIQAPLAWLMSLLARARWTMTWSLHQYQILEIARPKIIPDQGRSESPGTALRRRCIAYLGTSPHISDVSFGLVLARIVAVALKYFSTKPSYPPISW